MLISRLLTIPSCLAVRLSLRFVYTSSKLIDAGSPASPIRGRLNVRSQGMLIIKAASFFFTRFHVCIPRWLVFAGLTCHADSRTRPSLLHASSYGFILHNVLSNLGILPPANARDVL